MNARSIDTRRFADPLECFSLWAFGQGVSATNACADSKPTADRGYRAVSSGTGPITLKRYAALVAALYRGPRQERPWQDFLEELRSIFEPCVTVIGLRLPRPGDPGITFVGGADYSAEEHRIYAEKFKALDPLVDLPDGKVVALDDVIPREELKKTVYYRAFMEPADQAQLMGLDIQVNGRVAVFLRLIRGRAAPDFTEDDREILRLIEPQLRELACWMDTSRTHVREQHLFEQASGSLAIATIILDPELRIVYANRVAEQLLRSNNGIRCVADRLSATVRASNVQLREALQLLLQEEKGGVPVVIPIARPTHQYPLLLTLRRLTVQDKLDDTHHIAVYMTAPEIRQINQMQLVADAFELTPQEARLVIALANGGTLDQFVEQAGISRNTARTHLYSTFRKVGVSQQSALVSHVIRAIYGL